MPKVQRKAWVTNTEADQIVSTVQSSIRTGAVNQDALQSMMDMIVCVENYNINDKYNQGIIKRIFNREKFNGSRGKNISNHFGYDLNDVVSIFWEEIFNKLPSAQVTGTNVQVRNVNGQELDIQQQVSESSIRQTKCNPIYYLRNRGIMAVRNALNGAYRSNLKQVCTKCGHQASASTHESKSLICPVCKSNNTSKFWPDGNSSYGSRKWRKCNMCSSKWERKFAHTCAKCGSDEVFIEQSIVYNDDTVVQVRSDAVNADEYISECEEDANISVVIEDVYSYLPTDPTNATAETKTHEVFNILVKPLWSKSMCEKCNKDAPKVCEDKCEQFAAFGKCEHNKIPDPAACCGSNYFNSNCVNYSKKIGEFHGCSASLTARRVKKVREYFKRYIIANKDTKQCSTLYALLERKRLL